MRHKYPRTPHLSFSPGVDDDRIIDKLALNKLLSRNIIITEKMDGENTTLYSDYLHSRSLDAPSHLSQSWVREFHSKIKHEIPEGWRICGENMFAKHSIYYNDLETYFFGFSVWTDKNVCLPWWETLDWFYFIGIEPVNVLYHGPGSMEIVNEVISELDLTRQEGIVIRSVCGFNYDQFGEYVCKWVRRNHNQTSQWDETIKNDLRKPK